MKDCDKCGVKIDGKPNSTVWLYRWNANGSEKGTFYFELCSGCTDKIEKILLEREGAE